MNSESRWRGRSLVVVLLPMGLAGGCTSLTKEAPAVQRPDVSPQGQTAQVEALALDSSKIQPMYTELLPVDLTTVVRVAAAQNVDIRMARQSVQAARGRLESVVGGVFPAIVPTAIFERLDGGFRNTDGRTRDDPASQGHTVVALQRIHSSVSTQPQTGPDA